MPRALLFLLVIGTTPAARADGPRERALELVREGNRLLGDGACGEALRRFEQARQAYPTYKIEVNLGTTSECLGRLPKAAEHFERFLAAADPTTDAVMIRGVTKKLDELRLKLARIELRCEVAGAQIRLDGSAAGRTPAGRFYLTPGEHQLLVEKPGHRPFAQQLRLDPGEDRRLRVQLPALAAAAPAASRIALLLEAPVARTLPPSPIYKRWWLWALVGVAVVGVTAAVVATQTGGSDRVPVGTVGTVRLE